MSSKFYTNALVLIPSFNLHKAIFGSKFQKILNFFTLFAIKQFFWGKKLLNKGLMS